VGATRRRSAPTRVAGAGRAGTPRGVGVLRAHAGSDLLPRVIRVVQDNLNWRRGARHGCRDADLKERPGRTRSTSSSSSLVGRSSRSAAV
jgi:hypothetical protein